MNICDMFPTKYLRAADLRDQQTRVQMHSLQMEEVSNDDDEKIVKPVLYFVGHEKGLMLNRTNANTIVTHYGPESDDWMGFDIILFPTMVDFKGVSTPAIRVKVPVGRDARREPVIVTVPRVTNGHGNGALREAVTIESELGDHVPF